MQAVIEVSGRQWNVSKGDLLTINRLETKAGEKVTFDKVLMAGANIGAPYVKGAKVTAVVKEHKLADKVVIFKYKRRKNYKKMFGHRQPISVVEIQDIQG